MDVKPLHSYALTPVPDRRVASDLRKNGTRPPGFTSMVVHNPKSVILCGHTSGAIHVFRKSKQSASVAEPASGEAECLLPANNHDKLKDEKTAHKGQVTMLKFHPESHHLYSCSADRTVKIWDIFHPEHMPTCVQTVTGHGGSVVAIDFATIGPSPGYMFTASTDKSVIMWKNAEGRDIMLYPFYVKMRVVDMKIWPNCLVFCSARMGQGDLYIGDSDGKISHVRMDADVKAPRDLSPTSWHTQASSHVLGVTSLGAEPHEGLLLSTSNDTSVKLWEQASGVTKKSLKNENRCRFNSMCINSFQQEVFLVDDMGWLHIWSWVSERLVFSDLILHNGTDPLYGIGCNTDGTEIYVMRAQSVDSFSIIRGISRVALKGHDAPIVGVGFLLPGKEEVASGEEILYSCAHDNTLRSWDPLTMQCSNIHRETAASEMSAFALLLKYRLVFTGNDDGSLRMWVLDSGQHSITTGHTNTVSAIATAWTGHSSDDPSGRDLVFTCGFDGDVLTWEVSFQPKKADSSDDQIRILPVGRTKAHKAEILCCAYFPADVNPTKYPNGLLVTAGNDLSIKKWQVSDRHELELAGQLECTLPDGFTSTTTCHQDSITSMAVDANFLFTASADCTIRIWDMPGSFLVRTLSEAEGGHSEPVKTLLIIPSEGYLVSLSVDMIIKIWDYTCSKVIWETRTDEELTCMVYDERKHNLVCGTEDFTVITVDLAEMAVLNARRDKASGRGGSSEGDLDETFTSTELDQSMERPLHFDDQ